MATVSATYKIEGMTWRRPGVMDFEISSIVKADDPPPGDPKFEDHFTGTFSESSEVPQIYERRRERLNDIADKITWKYRCGRVPVINSLSGDAGFFDGTFWSMDVSLMQVPLGMHPNLKNILEAGAGVLRPDNEIEWPRYIGNRKNPWYSTTSFAFPSVTVSREKIHAAEGGVNGAKLNFSQIDNVGYSTDVLVDNGIGLPDNINLRSRRKKWLLESHTLSKTGKEYRERKVWRWGGWLGWADQLYDKNWTYKKK